MKAQIEQLQRAADGSNEYSLDSVRVCLASATSDKEEASLIEVQYLSDMSIS